MFKILSLDGGGIRGIYSAELLRRLEEELGNGGTLNSRFDLIAGTSTGGIIALGIGMGIPMDEIAKLYIDKGGEIFPPDVYAKSKGAIRSKTCNALSPKYDHGPLERLLYMQFGDALLGDSKARLLIPSFMVPKAEIAVFKTDHHSDYKNDFRMAAWEIARATSAAPTMFAGHERKRKMFVDGGIWANNPIGLAVSEALSAFDIQPEQLRILSIGTGNAVWEISLQQAVGGWFQWRELILGAMHLGTDNATSQISLLLGHKRVLRIEPEDQFSHIALDNWRVAKEQLPEAAKFDFTSSRDRLLDFIAKPVVERLHFRGQDAED